MIHLDHISVRSDAIGIVFCKSKTDQSGTKRRDPRHIYSNPMEARSCVFLAIAIYLACHPQLSMGKLFPGAAQKDRFGKQLAKLLSHPDPTCGRSEYGTHSIRKGASTFACSGSTGGPSIVSVCLRCGRSLGNVLERYMHYEGAGDQFLGRVMAGLPINDASFAILPPHFKMPFDSDVSSAINKVFPSLSRALEMLIPKSHPIFYSRVFTDVDMVPMLKARLVTHDSVLPATGIPPHVGLHKELTRATTEMRSIPNEVIRGVDALLETKGVAAGNLTQRLLKETLVEVVAPMVQALASSAEVSRARGPSMYCQLSHF
ncbi:hypothetical protein DYB31_011230 [Aphanomyces astaci]|uniref:Ndc10 domain-containing protein n=1 Tax=Aphanomyces astaci TaxID=112090 RepID=A0A397ESP2_APHAT|nr:hypothetical protein DYB31_011230 [Aphanomyces astaci]